uniref:BTB/POZ domain-containing protein At1g04390 n=1 Tax=Anthurium amnicola TaxID=1678845 RepID=A0A1D1XU70_9ARAE
MLVALEGILQSENETLLGPATNVTAKLFRSLGSSLCQYHSSDIILPLSNLLSFHQSTIVFASAATLKCILTNQGSQVHEDFNEIWNIIRKTKAIESIIYILQDCIAGFQPINCFTEMASLLRAILWRLPPSRYQVWNNNELMSGLVNFCVDSDSSVVVSILQLYSTLVLCGDVAIRFLSEEPLVCEMVFYVRSLQPTNVRIEALVFCEHLMRSEKGCSILTSLCCEPLVQGIIDAMSGWRLSHSEKVPNDHIPLVTAACRMALMTRWPGVHHAYFWKLGIDNVLLDLLLGNYKRSCQLNVPDELRAATCDNITDIRNYIWDILGWLAIHCDYDFHSCNEGKMSSLDTLIHCACLLAGDFMLMRCHSQHHSTLKSSRASELEPVSRAVMMMILSSCNYIASRARDLLWEIISIDKSDYLDCLLDTLKLIFVDDHSMASDNLETVVNLMSLVYYSSLPQCQCLVLEKGGLETLIAIIDRCLNGGIHVNRSSIAPHLYSSKARTCCWNHVEEQKGGNIILLYSLQALSQLISLFDFTNNYQVRSSGQNSFGNLCDNSKARNLFCNLQQIQAREKDGRSS